MSADDSKLPVRLGGRLTTWCLFAGAMVLLSVLLIRLLPCMPGAYPTHASEVIPGVSPLSAADLQHLEGTLRRPSASARFALIMAGEFGLWALMLVSTRGMSQKLAARAGWLTGTVLLVAQLGSPAMLSFDIYGYITHGRTLALHHVNPSSTQTVLSKDDPYLTPLGSYIPSQYGPLWSLVEGGLARVGGEHIGLTVLLFHLAAVLGTLVTAGVLWWCARGLCPGGAGTALVFFLCNPLVIFEMGSSGHNDCWMAAPLLAGVAWAARGNLPVAAACFALAALVKAPAALVGGFCVLALLKLLPGWRERFWRGALAALVGLAIAGAAFGSVRALATAGTARTGGFAALFTQMREAVLGTDYINSLHEIAFRIGRRLAGQDPQLTGASIYFQGWWLRSKGRAGLYRSPVTNAAPASRLEPGALVLVAAPQMSDNWVYVYDPAGRRRGFVRTVDVEETSNPPQAQQDPELADLSLPLGQRSLSVRVSVAIRLATWLAFGAAFLWLVSRTRQTAQLPAKCLTLLVCALYLIASWFWPWYVLWALPLAAITPGGWARMLTIQLSATALLLYATSESAWLYAWRAAFVFGLPLLGTASLMLIAGASRGSSGRWNWWRRSRCSSSANR